MYYLIAVLILIMLIISFIFAKKNIKDNDIIDDVPIINVNRDDLEKSAVKISHFDSVTKKISLNKKLVIRNLDKSYKKIISGYEYIAKEVKNKNEVVQSAEWLLDNLYLIEREYKDIKRSMPISYYENLPVLKEGLFKGLPRVYFAAVEMVNHSDGKIDEKTIETFINAFQKNTIMTSGELWALPIMIRIALIQNISRITEGIVFAQKEINKGENIAEKLINAVNDDNIEAVIDDINKNDKLDYNSHFVERLLKILRDNCVENLYIFNWIGEKLESKDNSIERLINIEHQKQAAYQILIGNCITGIREVSNLNWKVNFERLSYVENTLKKDPYNLYEYMDFQSRDYYRHRIEKISKYTKLSEAFIAKKSIECAEEACVNSHCGDYEKHVGFYIVDDGLESLKSKLGYKDRGILNIKKYFENNTLTLYLGFILIGTLIIASELSIINYSNNYNYEAWKFVLAFFAVLIPCSEIIVSTFNWSINFLCVPRFIPKVEYKDGIPKEYSTIVTIPAILENEGRVRKLILDIEVYYLANKEENLYFALLGDFKDSKLEIEESDEIIIKTALEEVEKLNKKYCKSEGDIFYFLNRTREYNENEGIFMGWERKRGKLVEFNRLLRGTGSTSYKVISGKLDNLKSAKYIITLDSDTQLPMNSAKKLIGAMSHVLNKPFVDSNNKKIVRGHGLMQPRISISTVSANKTIFSKIFSGETGIDVYSTSVSDVYEDLFDEGIYTGKGIYDIDVFMNILEGEIPENLVLSHDLLEGSYIRAALLTDVEFVDDYPAYYNSGSRRLHRWVRGDWQIISWLFKPSPLNNLSKWKIIDNLRRSLIAPSIFLLIILALTILPGEGEWLFVAFASILCPILFDVSETVVSHSKEVSFSGKIKSCKIIFEQVFLVFAFLPYNSYLMMDAIIRTLYRINISKKNLLEWQTAESAEHKCGKELKDYLKNMGISILIAVVILIFSFHRSLNMGILLFPSCIIWIFSPFLAYIISLDKTEAKYALTKDQDIILRRIARKTWAYFDDFVGESDNWLAPDNYQEFPNNGLAHRTSPTNLGMGLISNISAFDLGYLGILEMLDRLENILNSMGKLEKYKGHFYNWYDTKTRSPLTPRYISTVDSGNLVGYLWVIYESLIEYSEGKFISENVLSGICDTLRLAQYEIESELCISNYYTEIIEKMKNCEFNTVFWKNILKSMDDKSQYIIDLKNKKDLYWNNKLKISIEKFENEIDTIESCQGKEMIQARIKNINEKIIELVNSTDFSILYEEKRQLFSIGFDVEKGSMGNCYYDLLASEARQASFISVAKGDVDPGHWFKLGRSMAEYGGSRGLVSWSGTMFEYYMPLLIMKNFPSTLLNETYKAVTEAQKDYCKNKSVLWGISESAFYNFDINMNYQYKAFGVPKVGLKRGLVNELVISPYSTLLAMLIDLKGSLININSIIKSGLEGKYGFYEAVDYTKDRLPKGMDKAIIKCFMVHHEGMGLMAIHNVLNSNILQERFHRIPEVKAAELLLQEKVPKTIIYNRNQKYEETEVEIQKQKIVARRFSNALTDNPETHILSNGEYSLMITNSGGGYSKKGETMIYRWKEDVTCDLYGLFFYVKNINSGEYWSSTYEPSKVKGDKYEVIFSQDKAQFERKDGNITTRTEITVSQEDNAEIRKITLMNHGEYSRIVEITSFLEVTLTKMDADLVHPAFSNLFIKTEYLEKPECILATRKPRASNDKQNWLVHTLAVEGETIGKVRYETSRANFVGRCRNLEKPEAMDDEVPLKNTVGAVIDPILSLRVRLKIEKGKSCVVYFTTGISDSREEVIELAKKYCDICNISRAFELSWTQSILQMKYMGIKSPQANLFQSIASKILYINESFKEREAFIKNISKGQSALWCYGISGDIPIVLVTLRNKDELDTVRQMLAAHEYLSNRGLKFDLIILNLQESSYIQSLQDLIRDLAGSSYARDKQNKCGGIFLFSRATINSKDIGLLMAISRFVVDCRKGSLMSQMKNIIRTKKVMDNLNTKNITYKFEKYKFKEHELQFFNGLGGFDCKNNSYIILLKEFQNTPAPWINVISNGDFGFQVSENGVSYTWNKNSRENKLTSWSNDPITDSESEAIYLRDEINGSLWGISPKPIRDEGEYIIEHGFGYSYFKHAANGVVSEMTMFTPISDNLKIVIVKLKNISNACRSLSVTYYGKLVLGVCHEKTAQYIFSEYNSESEYIYSQNSFSEHFNKFKCYLKIIGGEKNSFTGDRKEFIGKNGSIEKPEALKRISLSNTVGAGYDPCLAVNSKIELAIDEERDMIVLLGQEEESSKIEDMIYKYGNIEGVNKALEEVKSYWSDLLNVIQVKTPDKTMDIMLNGWLIYQTLVCRIWARTAFYQSGGAYGFRDQLQDVMALSYLDPSITRKQIIYSASRQFVEGDVQHWWHPVVESGIRTRFSDDLLWLPYVTIDYIKNTGDYSILDEEVSYIEDEPLKPGEDERYNATKKSLQKGSIYEHCLKAVEKSLVFGKHNIPLMGSGDWNDGMSTVGNKGSGESVWMGWFIYSILDKFIPICKIKGDEDLAEKYSETKNFIILNMEKNAWDGDWYRRAYFDDGSPLGSVENDECQIDSLVQSWAVISGGAKDSRAKICMESLEKHLVKEDKGLVVLFSPPFDKTKMEPGYIKGYLPGVRENGGQYTHAAVWVIIALAKIGNGNKAWNMFNMINPINHTRSNLECEIYKTEPYVMTADIYAATPYIGRGGWSWYTGAAGWMYRTGIEWILGLKIKEGIGFKVEPCIPDNWDDFSIKYRRGKCKYNIQVNRGNDKGSYLDKEILVDGIVPFFEEGEHEVRVVI